MQGSAVEIHEFDIGDGDWRIEALGAVEYTSHGLRMQVSLVPGELGDLTNEQLALQRQHVPISVGQLPYLRVGSHWRRGRQQKRTTGDRCVLKNVMVRDDTTQLVRLGASLGTLPGNRGGQRWLVPPFKYPLSRAMYDSECIAIERDGDPYGILLPVAEAIRFYYAPSSDLAHVMFDGMLEHDRDHVIDPNYTGPADGLSKRMVVALRGWLADSDAWILGRILLDQHASRGAALIHESLIAAGANEGNAFPKCSLPFAGAADWKVRAVNIAPGGAAKSRWLILEIESCSAPFPYEELEVIRDNERTNGDPQETPADGEFNCQPFARLPRRDPRTAVFQSAEASRADLEPIVFVDVGLRFSALKDKKIIKTAKKSLRYKPGQLFLANPVSTGRVGTDQGANGEKAISRAKIEWTPDEPAAKENTRRVGLAATFNVLMSVVDAMNQFAGVSASVRLSKSIALVPLAHPVRTGDWAWLDRQKRRRRAAMIVDIKIDGIQASVVECELRPTETCAAGILISMDAAPIPDRVLYEVLKSHSKARGVWRRTRGAPSLILISLKHSQATYAARAKAILDRIRAAQTGQHGKNAN